MSEYKHTISKQPLTGFAGDPPQQTNNAQGAMLDSSLTIKNAVVIGTAVSNAKKVFGTGFNAIVSEIGNTRLEDSINIVSQGLEYAAIGAISLPALGLTIIGDIAQYGIETAVGNHARTLQNEIISNDRGTRVKYNTGGYYG